MNSRLTYIIFFILISHVVQSKDTVRVGAFNYYPAIFKDTDGLIKGFYVDALDEIEKNENIHFEYIYGSWNQGLERMKSGEINIMPSVAYTYERATYMKYTDIPTLTVWGEVYIKTTSEIQGIKDLANKKIVLMEGDFNGMHLKNLTEKFSIPCTYIYVADFNSVFELIANRDVDAGVVNNTFGAAKSIEYNLKSSGIIFNPFDIYFTVGKENNEKHLILLNTYLKKWKYDNNSIFNRSREKWSHGNVGSIKFIPGWIQKSIYIAIASILLLIVFVALLNYRVKIKTKEAKNNELLFKSFMENIPGFVYIKDENLNHIYKNKMVLSLLELSAKNITTSAKSIFTPEIVNLVETADKQILHGETDQLDIQYSCIINNQKRWLHDYKFKIQHAEEKPLIGGVSFDITDLKEAESNLLKAKTKAEESDKLKTIFLQNLSHEIRTPMNAILGFSKFLLSKNIQKDKQLKFINIIQDSTQQLLTIINDILSIALIETNQETPNTSETNINKIIDNLHSIFIRQLNQNNVSLTCIKELTDNEAIILTDNTKLTQILTNLLSNAIKFTHTGSISFGYTIKNDYIEFYVSDTGIGIEKENIDIIFRRFIQANKSIQQEYGGTGLGLSIARAYVQLLGGTMSVESEINVGSTFRFTIPLKQVNQTPENQKPDITIPKGLSIIVAEDEIYNFQLIEEILHQLNATIIHTTTGTQTVEACKNNTNVDLIIMDIKMPDMDGVTAAEHIKKMNPNIPIIAQTAYYLNKEMNIHTSLFSAFIAKPLNGNTLLKLIYKCIVK